MGKEINPSLRRTDMALETKPKSTGEETGVLFREETRRGIPVSRLSVIGKAGEEAAGKPEGEYLSLSLGSLWLREREFQLSALTVLSELIAEESRSLLGGSLPHSVLAVCLGNRAVTPDAIGPLVFRDLCVSRHLTGSGLLRKSDPLLSAILPGVVGQTGIETLSLVRGAADEVRPDLVICVDSLASRSPERLGTTLQIATSGIFPGSGVGNHRLGLTPDTLGVKMLSLGVPTVTDSSALVLDSLEKAGDTPSEALLALLENGKGWFVSRKETDEIVSSYGKLISGALNRLFSPLAE